MISALNVIDYCGSDVCGVEVGYTIYLSSSSNCPDLRFGVDSVGTDFVKTDNPKI